MTDPAYRQLRSRYDRPRDRGTADKRDESRRCMCPLAITAYPRLKPSTLRSGGE